MAGYDWSAGMSNNAVAAYDDGLVPASKIGFNIPARLIEKHCRYVEWHHSSKNFNCVKFYDRAAVLAAFGKLSAEEVAAQELPVPNPAAVGALAEYHSNRERVFEDCHVRWIEWTGSLYRPKATEREACGAKVSLKKQTATITLSDGRTFTKRLSTRGFAFFSQKNEEVRHEGF